MFQTFFYAPILPLAFNFSLINVFLTFWAHKVYLKIYLFFYIKIIEIISNCKYFLITFLV